MALNKENRWKLAVAAFMLVAAAYVVIDRGRQVSAPAEQPPAPVAPAPRELPAETLAYEPPAPSPDLSPQAVMELLLGALQQQHKPVPFAGSKTAFAFASPANREVTGPLERFIRMTHTPAYAPLLGFVGVELIEARDLGERFECLLAVTQRDGRTYFYLWALSRQADGDYAGCWMTDGVAPAAPPPNYEPPVPPERSEPKRNPKQAV